MGGGRGQIFGATPVRSLETKKMFHIFHFLQSDMVFGIVNSFSRVVYAISSEKSYLISSLSRQDSKGFRPCFPCFNNPDWSIQNFPRVSHMQGAEWMEPIAVYSPPSSVFYHLALSSPSEEFHHQSTLTSLNH